MTKPHFVPTKAVPLHVTDLLAARSVLCCGLWTAVTWEGGPEDHRWIRSNEGRWWYSVVPWTPPMIEASSFGSAS